MNEVLIVAAEASSALYAQRLLEYWRKHGKSIHAFGVGSLEMENLGFERLGKSEEMAVVGIAEVIEQYGHLKSVFHKIVQESQRRKPKVAIVMDYPDFNLMLAKKLKALGIPVLYYISPQVWAWRQGRIKKIKKYCEKVLLLFPFEKDFYAKHEVAADFVGHPLLDEIDPKYLQLEFQNSKRKRYGIHDDQVVLGLMPGSRKSELKHNLPVQLEAATQICREFPMVKIVILVAPSFSKEQVQEAMDEFTKNGKSVSFPYILVKDQPMDMICMVDLMIAASGTATLMVGLLHKPMVIMYRVKTATWWLSKIVAPNVKTVGLPNLILGRRVVPEKIQTGFGQLVSEVKKFLLDEPYRKSVQQELAKLSTMLGDKGTTQRVSAIVERYLSPEKKT